MLYSDPISAHDYHLENVLNVEQKSVFSKGWHLVGCHNDFAQPGDFLVADIGMESVVVINDQGILRALSNTCRHRAHPLLTGSGNTQQIVCPYHAWRYQTNGQLKRAPNSKRVEGFNEADVCLPQYAVQRQADLVWVCLSDNEAFPIAQLNEPANQISQRLGSLSAFENLTKNEYSVAANWKVVMDNYLECYHCGVGHKSFCEVMSLPSYHGLPTNNWSLQTAQYKGEVALSENAPQEWAFYTFFPNMIINITPGLSQINFMQAVPLSAEQTLVKLRTWYSGECTALAEQLRSVILDVKREDIAYCEAVQRGYRSESFSRGIIMTDSRGGPLSELAVLHFHQWLQKQVASP